MVAGASCYPSAGVKGIGAVPTLADFVATSKPRAIFFSFSPPPPRSTGRV